MTVCVCNWLYLDISVIYVILQGGVDETFYIEITFLQCHLTPDIVFSGNSIKVIVIICLVV